MWSWERTQQGRCLADGDEMSRRYEQQLEEEKRKTLKASKNQQPG